MKHLPFCLLLLACSVGTAQAAEDPLEYQKVIEVQDASASDLYLRSRTWFVESFVESGAVLEVEEEESHLLMGKGNVQCSHHPATLGLRPPGIIRFIIRVEAKDGRVRISLTRLEHSSEVDSFGILTTSEKFHEYGEFRIYRRSWENLKVQAESKALTIIESLELFLKAPKEDEW